jgi:glutaredoxin
MGCAPCEAAKRAMSASRVQTVQKTSVSSEDCEITMEQVDVWLEKIRCVIKTGEYITVPNITKKQLNIYLSFLLSAKNYADNPCYFRNELQEIEGFIMVLTARNICIN